MMEIITYLFPRIVWLSALISKSSRGNDIGYCTFFAQDALKEYNKQNKKGTFSE